MFVANKVSQNYLHIKALLRHQLCDNTISLSEDIFAYIDFMAETYFVSFVYVQKFIGHPAVNGNEFMMAPPVAGTRKHVIHAPTWMHTGKGERHVARRSR